MEHDEGLAVAIDATPLLGFPTGVGRFCASALEALAARRELTLSAYAVTWRRRRLLPPLLPVGVRAIDRPMPARPLHWAWARGAWPPIDRLIGPFAVVHGTNFVVPPARRSARVVTVHDLTALRFPELCDGPTLAYPTLLRRAIAEGAWVHTPSQFVADEVVAELGADPARVRAVHHGALTPPWQAQGRGESGPFVLPEGTQRYVLAVGTVEPRKDLPSLVRAFDHVAPDRADLALVIAGPDGWGTAALTEAIDGARCATRIIRTGYVDDATLASLVGHAAVLAYPSRYEGFGFPVLEAMALGTPVVTTSAGAIPEVAGDAALIVPPGDVDALAEGLVQVVDDDGYRQALVSRGCRRAASFTWERCAQGLASLYAEASQEKGSHEKGAHEKGSHEKGSHEKGRQTVRRSPVRTARVDQEPQQA